MTRQDDAPARGDRRAWLAHEFERHRPYLRGMAYRMLGSLADAEDALQECWLRLDRAQPDDVPAIRPWLITVLGRICLDQLRARRSRREDLAGTWLPEPIVAAYDSPEEDAVRADTVGLALLVVLETLNPAERLAFVLHDVFAVPFDQIAPIVGRSPAAARQLASRARRRVRGAPPTTPDRATADRGHRDLVPRGRPRRRLRRPARAPGPPGRAPARRRGRLPPRAGPRVRVAGRWPSSCGPARRSSRRCVGRRSSTAAPGSSSGRRAGSSASWGSR